MEVLRLCDNEIPTLLSRLIERYAINTIHNIYQRIHDNIHACSTYGHVEHTETVSYKGVEIYQMWTVPDFKNLLDNVGSYYNYVSPKLKGDRNFQLRLEIDRMSYRGSIRIYYLSPKQIFLKSVQLKSFTFDKSKWVHEYEESIIRTQEHQIIEADSWYLLKELSIVGSHLEDGYKVCFMKNGSFHLKFEFVITIEKDAKEYQFQIPLSELSSDMKSLFLRGMYTDVVMKSADDKEFKVHKGVLATRSEVLKAHFEHNTTESITNIVESPLESEVLREVLFFIYTDYSPKVHDIPEKLLVAADYYQLRRLKCLCEQALHEKLTVDNAIETLQLADLYSANTLKQLTLKFIKHDKIQLQLITKTKGWARLQSVDLMRRICE